MSASRRNFDPENAKRKKMRGKIIHYYCLMGYVDENGDPDFERINKSVQGLGTNKRGVILNFLYVHELPDVVTQVEQMWKKESRKMTEVGRQKTEADVK